MSVKTRLINLEKASPPGRNTPRTLFEFEFDTRSEFHAGIKAYSTLFPGQPVTAIEYGPDCDLRQDHPNYPGFDYER